MNPEIDREITFGKYKGKDIEAILADEPYAKWVLAQEGLRLKHPILYNIIQLHFNDNEDTPVHNSMQQRWLNKSKDELHFLFKKLISQKEFYISKELSSLLRFVRLMEKIEANHIKKPKPEGENDWDIEFEISSGERCFLELKPVLGDDYPSVLRTMKKKRIRGSNNIYILVIDNLSPNVYLDDLNNYFGCHDIFVFLESDI